MRPPPKVYLIEARSKRGVTYKLRWLDPKTAKYRQETVGHATKSGGPVSARAAEEARRKKEHGFAKGKPAGKPSEMKLDEFAPWYLEQRKRKGESGRGFRKASPRLKEGTLKNHRITLDYLREFFGDNHRLAKLTPDDIERFLDALADGSISPRYGKRSRNTVARIIMTGHAVFSWCIASGHLFANPFAAFSGTMTETAKHYVSLDDFERVIENADSSSRALLGLCRLAGLRREEAVSLVWSGRATDRDGAEHEVGVDLDAKRISLVAPKTDRFRWVPICPRLHELLAEAELIGLAEGWETVTGLDRVNGGGLWHHIVDAIDRTEGVERWPKALQSLRSSWENDLKVQGIAETTYCFWMGHTPSVSRDHYVTALDVEAERVTESPQPSL